MSDEETPEGEQPSNVLVFRNNTGQPVAVPEDVVTASERAYRCHKMRIAGHSWEAIAQQEGYQTAKQAKYDVDRYLEEARSLVVESSQREMLTLEVGRLDALQSALWPQAMAGHVPSAGAVLNIITTRSKLVGLDPDKMAQQADEARTVVLVPHESAGYIESLQRAAEQTNTPDQD